MQHDSRIGFIGAGNMARAMIGGLIKAGWPKEQIRAHDAKAVALEGLFASHGVGALEASFSPLAVLVLAVKPHDVAQALQEASAFVHADTLVISIAAGVPIRKIQANLALPVAIVRAMPNTPALIGAGITGAYANDRATARHRALADEVLLAAGEVVWVDDEADLDAVTAVSGSGPAYVFYFIEALEAAAIEAGLRPDVARRLALATFSGASKLAQLSSESPAVLREQVTSKGGTTFAALESMRQDGVAKSIAQAVASAHRRATELGAN